MAVFSLTRPELEQLIQQLTVAASSEGQVAAKRIVFPPENQNLEPAFSSLHRWPDVQRLARLIDHTMLRAEAPSAQIEAFCREAASLNVAAACVHPTWVSLAVRLLHSSLVKVCSVVGFPSGATLSSAKKAEAEAAIRAGAEELDMVVNIGALRSGNFALVESDIRGVVEIAHASGCITKVILENAYLADDQKIAGCRIAQLAGADFVKTSTGFAPSGATEADVRLMRETVGPHMGVKAAGGIRTLQDALRMLEAGADRLGSSSSVSILEEAARLIG